MSTLDGNFPDGTLVRAALARLEKAFRQVIVSTHVGETPVSSLKEKGVSLVIQTEEREHGGMQVVDVDLILDRSHPQVVGGSDHLTSLDSGPRQPAGEAIRVVISTQVSLHKGSSAELSDVNHQCALQ